MPDPYYTDSTLVSDEQVQQARAERKRIPDGPFQNGHEWFSISTSDFALIRLDESGNHWEFALVRRAEPPFEDTDFIPGGRINWGESPDDACIRHLERELGITDVEPKFRGHLSVINPASETRPLWHSIWHIYTVPVSRQQEFKLNTEASRLTWFDTIQAEFPDPVWAALKKIGFSEEGVTTYLP